MNNSSKYDIMRTAILTAFPKIFTDIPYSNSIFQISIQNSVALGFSFDPYMFSSEMSLEIEARYKSLNAMINEQLQLFGNDLLIIEFGSGLSPRRLEFNKTKYYEFDLPQINALKKHVYETLDCEELSESLCDVDLKCKSDVEILLSAIQNNNQNCKVIIVSEGLFWYLNRATISSLIRVLIKLYNDNWIWLTSDCPTQSVLDKPYKHIISKSSNRNPLKPFRNVTEYFEFFNSLSCDVSSHKIRSYISEKNLFSADLFSINNDEVIERVDGYTDLAIISPINDN